MVSMQMHLVTSLYPHHFLPSVILRQHLNMHIAQFQLDKERKAFGFTKEMCRFTKENAV